MSLIGDWRVTVHDFPNLPPMPFDPEIQRKYVIPDHDGIALDGYTHALAIGHQRPMCNAPDGTQLTKWWGAVNCPDCRTAGGEITRLPEWMIGGPMHGKDRTDVFPDYGNRDRILVPAPVTRRAEFAAFFDAGNPLEIPGVSTVHYDRTPIAALGESWTAWVDTRITRDTILTHLTRLILAPHKRSEAT